MDREEIRKRLMQTFLDELPEHVETLNQALLHLEQRPNAQERSAELRAIFRTAHTLKGDARAVGLDVLESACHEVEARLSDIQRNPELLSPGDVDLLFEFADALQAAYEQLRRGETLAQGRLAELLPRLKRDVGTPKEATSSPVIVPEPEPVREMERSAAATAIRLPARKLDALHQSVTELLADRSRPRARRQQLEQVRDMAHALRGKFLALQRGLDRSEKEIGEASEANVRERLRSTVARGRSRLVQLEKELEALQQALLEDELSLTRSVNSLYDEVQDARLVPFSDATAGLERQVRDLAHQFQKQVRLECEGGDLELDRYIVQQIREPLLHLIRNAVDHGIESPDVRRARGKSPQGVVRIEAQIRGNEIAIEVSDDGQGIHWNKLYEQARRRGIQVPDEAQRELIFAHGVSTAEIITEISGRGVGLDVVRSRTQALRGDIDVESQEGQGTRFRLLLPLEISSRNVLLVAAGGQTVAIDHGQIAQLIRFQSQNLRQLAGRPALESDGMLVPLVRLSDLLQLPEPEPPPRPGESIPVMVLKSGRLRVGIAVERLLASEEVTVQTLHPRVQNLPLVNGSTIRADGRIVLLLDAHQLVSHALQHRPSSDVVVETPAPVARKRLLVADDSLTTRTLEKTILEAAGYEVLTAVSGVQAWELLQQRGADLLITDVEMPGLDGFQLTEAVRQSSRHRELPVILLTARQSEQDRRRGLEVGANAYLVKSTFDQRALLETVAQLL